MISIIKKIVLKCGVKSLLNIKGFTLLLNLWTKLVIVIK